MADYIPVVRVGILDRNGKEARFTISIFGLPYSHFMQVPGGGNEIREALKLQGCEGYMSTPFFIDRVYDGELRP